MDDFFYINNNFDILKTSAHHLSIQASLDGFSFSIHNKEKNKCLAIKKFIFTSQEKLSENYLESLISKIQSDIILSKPFASVNFILGKTKSSLVPTKYFSPKNADSIIKLSHNIDKNDLIKWNLIDQINIYAIFSIPKDLNHFLVSKFPKLTLSSLTYKFIKQSILKKKNRKEIFAHIENNEVFLFFFDKKGKHFYFNSEFENESDSCFFILNTFKDLKLDTKECNLILSGQINNNSSIIITLKDYISNIEIKTLESEFSDLTKQSNLKITNCTI